MTSSPSRRCTLWKTAKPESVGTITLWWRPRRASSATTPLIATMELAMAAMRAGSASPMVVDATSKPSTVATTAAVTPFSSSTSSAPRVARARLPSWTSHVEHSLCLPACRLQVASAACRSTGSRRPCFARPHRESETPGPWTRVVARSRRGSAQGWRCIRPTPITQGKVRRASAKPCMHDGQVAQRSGRELSIRTITPSAFLTRIFQRSSKRACPGVPNRRTRSPLSSVSWPKSRPRWCAPCRWPCRSSAPRS